VSSHHRGVFLTQQVSGDYHDLYDPLDVAWSDRQLFSLGLAGTVRVRHRAFWLRAVRPTLP